MKSGTDSPDGEDEANGKTNSADLKVSVDLKTSTTSNDLLQETQLVKHSSGDLTDPAKVVSVACCFMVNLLCVGFGLGLGVLLVPILELYQTSRALTSLLSSVCIGMIFSGSLFANTVVERLGRGNSMMLGGLIALAGMVGGSFATNVIVVIVCIGFIAGFGLCLAHFASFMTVNMILRKRKGLGVSIINAGSATGGAITPLFNSWLLDVYGWRGALMMFGGVIFHLVVLGLIIRVVTKSVNSETTKTSFSVAKCFRLIRNVRYTILVICSIFVYICMLATVLLLVDVMTDRGYTIQAASIALTVFSTASVLGSLLGGCLNSTLGMPGLPLAGLACICISIGSLLFKFLDTQTLLIASSGLMGIGLGEFTFAGPLALTGIYKSEQFADALSILFAITGLVDMAAGPFGGAIRDLTGSYAMLFYISATLVTASGLTLIFIGLFKRGRH